MCRRRACEVLRPGSIHGDSGTSNAEVPPGWSRLTRVRGRVAQVQPRGGLGCPPGAFAAQRCQGALGSVHCSDQSYRGLCEEGRGQWRLGQGADQIPSGALCGCRSGGGCGLPVRTPCCCRGSSGLRQGRAEQPRAADAPWRPHLRFLREKWHVSSGGQLPFRPPRGHEGDVQLGGLPDAALGCNLPILHVNGHLRLQAQLQVAPP
ncbi:unnamed protein product [Symbiodinium sp. CCMP2456]|nr:unnamed protein product [Symbiodinium sp. CCMP2456]